MHTAIITLPSTFLYETIIIENGCTVGKNISDELLSGWTVLVQQQCNNYSKIITHYGYSGWLNSAAICDISQEEFLLWNTYWIDSEGSFRTINGISDKNFIKTINLTSNKDFIKTIDPIENKNFPFLAILCKGMTDVLKEPRVQAELLSTLFMGSTVLLYAPSDNGWQKIKTAEGICGYIPSISLLSSKDIEQNETQLRSAIINYAMSYLGTQYRWGGKTHAGIDCSGLTFMSYYMCGIFIYRDAAIVDGYPIQEIPFSKIRPADLLYFPGHVALYLGNWKYIHATGNLNSFGCVINSLNPKDSDYREDLANSLKAVGSVFS